MKNKQHACDGGICKSEWRGLFFAPSVGDPVWQACGWDDFRNRT